MPSHCYTHTEYCYIVRNLLSKSKNSASKEKCPKCLTEISSYYFLRIHIEKFHPNDVKHKPLLKQNLPLPEETVNQNDEVFETINESFETANEDLFHMFQTYDSFTNSSTLNELKNNPFFKVIMILN